MKTLIQQDGTKVKVTNIYYHPSNSYDIYAAISANETTYKVKAINGLQGAVKETQEELHTDDFFEHIVKKEWEL